MSRSAVNHDPITSTFCFSQGIGLGTERKLWDGGVLHWDHVFDGGFSHLSTGRARALRTSIGQARRDLEADRADFARDGLSNAEMWRIYPRYRARCIYLDIETTGLDAFSDVTLIGLYDGAELTILERGKNLDRFPAIVRNYSMIVTFNGRCFDVPFLQREFPSWRPTQAHWDLRWALRSVGYNGGLKDIEKRMRLGRPGPLTELDGFDAVILWHAYKRGDREALSVLKRYLAEDVLGLVPLAERAFNLLADEHPLSVSALPLSSRSPCDLDYNPRAIRRILGR